MPMNYSINHPLGRRRNSVISSKLINTYRFPVLILFLPINIKEKKNMKKHLSIRQNLYLDNIFSATNEQNLIKNRKNVFLTRFFPNPCCQNRLRWEEYGRVGWGLFRFYTKLTCFVIFRVQYRTEYIIMFIIGTQVLLLSTLSINFIKARTDR